MHYPSKLRHHPYWRVHRNPQAIDDSAAWCIKIHDDCETPVLSVAASICKPYHGLANQVGCHTLAEEPADDSSRV